jgi:hypothetical protein
MQSLPIVWQRLVSAEGKTCERCGATHDEVERAVATLKLVLGPLGIEPRLEVREIDEASFNARPGESNRIWIAGRPMEKWIQGSVGASQCASVCGGSECRTVEVNGSTYEAIPERLILKASLLAAAELLDVSLTRV